MSDPDPKKNEFGERHIWKVAINAPIETVWNTLVKTDQVLPFLFGVADKLAMSWTPEQNAGWLKRAYTCVRRICSTPHGT